MNVKPQLFGLHFAGGSCYSFDFLKDKLAPHFNFIPLELPGRGKRFHEDLIANKHEAVQDYVKQIVAHRNNEPFLIYGHSMGAILGLSVTKQMELLGDEPLALVVTGNAGPGIERKEYLVDGKPVKRFALGDEDFKIMLRELGGVTDEILDNAELFDFFQPIIRSDFSVLENDDYSEKGIVINAPIRAIMGDEEETAGAIDNWKAFTESVFGYQILSGNHFFIKQHESAVVDALLICSRLQLSK